MGLLLCELQLPAQHFAVLLKPLLHALQLPTNHCAAKEDLFRERLAHDSHVLRPLLQHAKTAQMDIKQGMSNKLGRSRTLVPHSRAACMQWAVLTRHGQIGINEQQATPQALLANCWRKQVQTPLVKTL